MKISRHDVNGHILWQGRHLSKGGCLMLHVAENLSDCLIGLYRHNLELNNAKEEK